MTEIIALYSGHLFFLQHSFSALTCSLKYILIPLCARRVAGQKLSRKHHFSVHFFPRLIRLIVPIFPLVLGLFMSVLRGTHLKMIFFFFAILMVHNVTKANIWGKELYYEPVSTVEIF